jgi:hypothetical protein
MNRQTKLGILFLLTPILVIAIFYFMINPNLSNNQIQVTEIAKNCNPKTQTCCKYEGKYYFVNDTRGSLICRPDGTWGRKG